MYDVQLADVTVGSTRIIAWMGSSLSEVALAEEEELLFWILINSTFQGEGLGYFCNELSTELLIATDKATLYEAKTYKQFGRTDEELKASLQAYLEDTAESIEKFNSVSSIF